MPRRPGPEPAPERPGSGGRRLFGWPRWVWWLITVLFAALTASVVVTRRRELEQAVRLIAEVDLSRLAVGAACEAVSIVCLAAVLRWLLAAGGTRWSLGRWTAIMLGANAMAGAIPGGAAVGTAWNYRQLHRRGVEQSVSAAVLLAAGLLSMTALGLLMVAGVLTAGSKGPAVLVHPVVGALVVLLLFALAVFLLTRSEAVRDRMRRSWEEVGRRRGRVGRLKEAADRTVSQARGLEPGFRPWLVPLAFALLNWLFDIACLVACMWALDVTPPWHGLLLAYTVTQLPGSLRLTPGSLGVIEASLAALLVLYGMRAGPAIAATLLYRLFSFWALQLVGWVSWCAVTYRRVDEPASGG